MVGFMYAYKWVCSWGGVHLGAQLRFSMQQENLPCFLVIPQDMYVLGVPGIGTLCTYLCISSMKWKDFCFTFTNFSFSPCFLFQWFDHFVWGKVIGHTLIWINPISPPPHQTLQTHWLWAPVAGLSKAWGGSYACKASFQQMRSTFIPLNGPAVILAVLGKAITIETVLAMGLQMWWFCVG